MSETASQPIRSTDSIQTLCIMCGNSMPTTFDYCGQCGSELVDSSAGDLQKRRVLRTYFRDFIFDLLIPFLVGIKTTWLIFFKPTEFCRTIFFQEKPADDISFPLSRFWRRISDAPQYVFQPGQYWFFVLAFMAVVQILLRDGGALQMSDNMVSSEGGAEFASGNLFFVAIRPLINRLVDDWGISSDLLELPFDLIYVVFIFFSTAYLAFIFHQLMGKNRLPSNHNFTFWLYFVGALFIGIRLVILSFGIIARPNSEIEVSFLRNIFAIVTMFAGFGFLFLVYPLYMPTLVLSNLFESISLKRAFGVTLGTYAIYCFSMWLLYTVVSFII